ncbi:MAG: hypothetical protein L0Y72_06665 [Gemmataceae bacterium]|nr:hypothetical protein [Gemmataceae bacterium]
MFVKLGRVHLVMAWVVLCGFSDAGGDQKEKGGRIIGELKSQTNSPDGKNTIIEVLAPGEEKARRYHVQYDPKIKAPIKTVLAAVRAAKVGDVVEFEWVPTGHGPAIKAFQVFKKGTGDNRKNEQHKEQAGADAKVQELLKERLATLKELASATKTAYVSGKATIGEHLQANTMLLKAELDSCGSDKERLAVHERAVALAKECEKVAAHLHNSGHATHASVLAAKANRLDAEVTYERAKAKAKLAHPH